MTFMRAIFNPSCNRGRSAHLALVLRDYLTAREADTRIEWVETRAPRHAIALAQDASLNGCQTVIAIGGDGTVNEVINGLMQAGEAGRSTTLGVVPIGSGNDFAWSAGIPRDPLAAAARLFDGQIHMIDLGFIREAEGCERYFCNGCGVGFDAQVVLEIARMRRRLGGFLMYLVGVLRTLAFHNEAPQLRIQLDERELVQRSMMLILGNGRRLGGGFLVTPQAEMDDGLFDVCIAGYLSRLGILMILPRFVRGTHVTHQQVRMERARRVSVESPIPRAIHLDGEVFATAQSFEAEITPAALRVRI
jgi:diacylglycerol kinase (ATP)